MYEEKFEMPSQSCYFCDKNCELFGTKIKVGSHIKLMCDSCDLSGALLNKKSYYDRLEESDVLSKIEQHLLSINNELKSKNE